jgi:hypothetical protein
MRIKLPRLPLKVALWALLALITAPAHARSHDDLPRTPPDPLPEANPIEINVPRGPTVGIPLSAYSITAPILHYRIKRPAEAGRLGALRMVSPTTAVVNYTPPAGAGPAEDTFSYQVQSEAGFSAPAEVHIHITDKDPLLSVPNHLDFGQVPEGSIGRQQLVIQNVGGGIADGDVQVPSPWSVDGSTDYHIAAGETQTFSIIFHPDAPGDFTGDIEYSGDSGRATDLSGKLVPRTSVSEGPIELKPEGGLPQGIIQVVNRTSTLQSFHVTPGPHVQTDSPTVDAPANGVGAIVVREKPGQTGAIHDLVTVRGPGVNVDVPVYVPEPTPTPPPMVAAIPADSSLPPPSIPPPSVLMRVTNDGTPTPDLPLLPSTPDSSDNTSLDGLHTLWGIVTGNITPTSAQAVTIFNGAPPARSYRVETENVILDDQGRPAQQWSPMLHTSVTASGPKAAATLSALRPNTIYTIRIVGLDPQSNIIETSAPVQIRTPRANPLPWKQLTLILALIALATWWWKTQRPLSLSSW